MTDTNTRREVGKEVSDFIADERKRALDKAGLTFSRLIRELKPIALSDIADYVTVSEDGSLQANPTKKIKKSKRPAIKAIKEHTRIAESAKGDIVWKDSRIEYVLHDKLSAITTLLKLRGDFPSEKVDVNVNMGLADRVRDARERAKNRS